MESYSVAQVESITGISGHKLRIWERRYKFLKPKRTPTNIRFYTADDLKLLINVGILTRHGNRISKIGSLSSKEISEKVIELLTDTDTDFEDDISSLMLSAINFDENLFNNIFQRQLVRSGFLATITDLIYPFLNRVGVMWTASRIIPSQEHFITNLVRQKIISSIDSLQQPAHDAPEILLFLFEGEDHELPLLIASFIIKDLGWKVYYLGQNIPLNDIVTIIKKRNIPTVMSMITAPQIDKVSNLIYDLISNTDVHLILSGSKKNIPNFENLETVSVVNNPTELISQLHNLSNR